MRKKTGGIIFIIIVIAFTGSYFTIPAFMRVVDANTALVTSLGVIIAIFLGWYSIQSEKKIQKESDEIMPQRGEIISRKDLEKEVVTVLSPLSGLCLGRDQTLLNLEKDLEHRNILLIKGIAGIGKTTLGLTFRDRLEEKRYQTFWHQFDSQSYEGLLLELSAYLKKRGSVSAAQLKEQGIPPDKRLKLAVQELCMYPTILFFDNFQVFKDDSPFEIFKSYLRNSRLVIMSRIQPKFLSGEYESLGYLDRDSSVELLKTLHIREPQNVLEKIYEKTRGHPWSLVCFSRLSRALPVRTLLDELPDFSVRQQTYIAEQCWQYLRENEKDFLMRASAFTKPLNFDVFYVCSKAGVSEILISLAESFYILKRGDTYYIHDIIKDFALLKLKEDQKLYTEAQREAAGYYQERVSAENLLLLYHHLKEAGDHRGAVKSIVYNIEYFWREGFWADVKGVLEESLDFSEDEKTIADIYHDLGSIVRRLGEWDKAIDYYEKSLEIFKKLGDLHGIATTYNNLGSVYDSKGEWDKAIEYYEKDLEISEKLGDLHGIATTYNNLGSVYDSKGEWDKAIEYYEKSLEIKEKLGDLHGIALSKYGIANILSHKKIFDDALKLYFESERVLERLGDKFNLMNVYHNLALCYKKMDQEEKAKQYRQKSEELRKQLGIEKP